MSSKVWYHEDKVGRTAETYISRYDINNIDSCVKKYSKKIIFKKT